MFDLHWLFNCSNLVPNNLLLNNHVGPTESTRNRINVYEVFFHFTAVSSYLNSQVVIQRQGSIDQKWIMLSGNFIVFWRIITVVPLISWGVGNVTIIVEGNGIGELSSNPGRGCLCFSLCWCFFLGLVWIHLFFPRLRVIIRTDWFF